MKKTIKFMSGLIMGAMLLQGAAVPMAAAESASAAAVSLDFEDGTVGGLTLGAHGGDVTVTNAEENGNRFARLTMSGDFANSTDLAVMPDMYISPGYTIAPGSKTKISMKLRANNIENIERNLVFNYTGKTTYDEVKLNTIWNMDRSVYNANRGCNIMGLTIFDYWKNNSLQSYSGSNFYMNNPKADTWYKVDMTLYANTAGKIVKYDLVWTDEEAGTTLWTLSNRALQGDRENIPLYNMTSIDTIGLNLRVRGSVSGSAVDIDDFRIYNPDTVNTKVSLVSEGARASASDIQVQLSTRPDGIADGDSIDGVTVTNGTETVSATAVYDGDNSRIVITPQDTFAPGRYTVTLPESLTIFGMPLDEYTFTFIVTEGKTSAKEQYDFEDGNIPENWSLNASTGTSTLSVQTEGNGNKFARMTMTGDWTKANAFGERPNLAVTLAGGKGYAMTDKRWTDIFMRVRFSDFENTCFSMLVNQNENTANEIENSRKLWGFTYDTNWTRKYDRLNIFNKLSDAKTGVYANTSLGKGPVTTDKWYNVNVKLYTYETECGQIWIYITDEDGNEVWNPGKQNITKDSLVKLSSLNVIDTLNFDFTDFAKEITADSPITFDIDNLTVKEYGVRPTAALKNKIVARGENVVIALDSQLDFNNAQNDIKVTDAAGTEVPAQISYDAHAKEITLAFAENLDASAYTVTFGNKMTAEGIGFAKTEYTFNVVSEDAVFTYDFEDGTAQGWQLGETRGTTELTAVKEGENTFLRMTVKQGSTFNRNNQESGYTSTQPDMYVRTGYKMKPNSSVEISSKFRVNAGENTIKDLRARMMLNSMHNDLYSFGGNIYQLWGYEFANKDLRVVYGQYADEACWWMPDKKQGKGESLADASIMTDNKWYTVKTIFKTDAEGKPSAASYYLYDADGMLEASLINKTVDNWSLREDDKILDLAFSFTGLLRADDTISALTDDLTFDIDDVSVRNIESSVKIVDENGNEVTALSQGQNLKVKYDYTNTGVKAAKPMYAIAVYEKNGDELKLVAVKASESLKNITQGEQWSGISSEYVTVSGTGMTAKAFLWESGYIPVCAADEKN